MIAEKNSEKVELVDQSLQMSQQVNEKDVNSDDTNFDGKNFTDKVQYIEENMNDQLVTVDMDAQLGTGNVLNDIDGYTPAYSTDTTSAKTCSLYHSQGQQDFGRCWAASLSTILNYLYGTSYTAQKLCDDSLIGYNVGVSISQAMTLMGGYTTAYYTNLISSQATYSSVKTNINAKKPMYLSTVDTNNENIGHAIVLYGYQTINVTYYIVLWNPGIDGGIGGVQIVNYLDAGTTYAYNNSVFKWRFTLSAQ